MTGATDQDVRPASAAAVTEGYLAIEDYGVIGNLRTAALVGRNGSIDWCCMPRFDSPSLFAALLDRRIGGRIRIGPADGGLGNQSYLQDTNVLRTEFHSGACSLVVTDWMPVRGDLEGKGHPPIVPEIRRLVECREAAVEVDVEWSPRFDFARADVDIQLLDDGTVAAADGSRRIRVTSRIRARSRSGRTSRG